MAFFDFTICELYALEVGIFMNLSVGPGGKDMLGPNKNTSKKLVLYSPSRSSWSRPWLHVKAVSPALAININKAAYNNGAAGSLTNLIALNNN